MRYQHHFPVSLKVLWLSACCIAQNGLTTVSDGGVKLDVQYFTVPGRTTAGIHHRCSAQLIFSRSWWCRHTPVMCVLRRVHEQPCYAVSFQQTARLRKSESCLSYSLGSGQYRGNDVGRRVSAGTPSSMSRNENSRAQSVEERQQPQKGSRCQGKDRTVFCSLSSTKREAEQMWCTFTNLRFYSGNCLFQ